MKIALVTTFEQSVPPVQYGGTERIVSTLADELVRIGHDVTLYASGDSKTAAKLFPCTPQAVRNLPGAVNADVRRALNLQGLAKAVSHISQIDYDIVHNHAGWPFLLFEQLFSCPVVTTLHNTLDKSSTIFPTEHPMFLSLRGNNLVSISDSQRHHSPTLNYVATIYHGIDLADFSFNNKPRDYLVFLGRIHVTKGPEQAIKIALKTGKKLYIAARLEPPEMDYYAKEIEPFVDRKQIVFLGEIGQKEKIALLKDAAALLSPLAWDEPFGMVYIEALACGTPVIAIGRGSVPEIIINNKTGFVCRDIAEMTKRVADISTISRRACRDEVEKRFTATTMAKRYANLYRKLIQKSPPKKYKI